MFPQSHLHSHIKYPFLRSSVGLNATSIPNRCPARSFGRFPAPLLFFAQPQDEVFPLVSRLVGTKAVFPQSHLHSHTTYRFFRSSMGLNAKSLPNRCPVRSLTLVSAARSLFRQPQDRVPPLVKELVAVNVIFPQSHLHSQTTFFPFRSSVGLSTTSFPNRCPVKSLTGFRLALSRCRQPQDRVCPFTR